MASPPEPEPPQDQDAWKSSKAITGPEETSQPALLEAPLTPITWPETAPPNRGPSSALRSPTCGLGAGKGLGGDVARAHAAQETQTGILGGTLGSHLLGPRQGVWRRQLAPQDHSLLCACTV